MQRPRSQRARRLCLTAGLAVLLPPAVQAAAFLPGAAAVAADPPTGDNAPPPPPPPPAAIGGSGIRWQLAPWRSEGSLTLDLRWLRLEDGRRSTQGLVFGDIDFASYIHEPWFIQLRAGIGALAGRDSSGGGDSTFGPHQSGALTGRFAVAVFPASRFPFELRADVNDSRTRGDALGTDYRATRLSLAQAWRAEAGNDSLNLNLDHSRLYSDRSGSDTLTTLNANALRQLEPHTLELGANFSDNERSDTGQSSRLGLLSARYGFHPQGSLRVDTLASVNDARLRGAGSALSSTVRQISTFANWRPGAGEPLYSATSPLSLAGSARWVEAAADEVETSHTARAFNATLGANLDLTPSWRLAGALSAGRFDGGSAAGGAGPGSNSGSANASATWAPPPRPLGDWRWGPGATVSAGISHSGAEGKRHLEGLQLSHNLSRDLRLGNQQALSISVAQSAAVLAESGGAATTRALAHTGSLFWQSTADGGGQSFIGLSASDSRNWAQDSGRFQLINLQWSQRLQFTRYSSGATNLTLQTTRNDATLTDAFSGERRGQHPGWQRFYTASINFESQRAFGVPRLRYTLLVSANSQQLERRASGDIDAERERISESIENRLDYSIGRLEARLSARLARIDDRTVAALLARVQRRF